MITGFSRYITEYVSVLIQDVTNSLTTETGQTLSTKVDRGYNFDAPVLNQVWVECELPEKIVTMMIGNTFGGQDSQGLVLEDCRCAFGVRCKLPVERDNLFDSITAALFLSTNPNDTKSPARTWLQYAWGQYGINLKGIRDIQYTKSSTSRYGEIFEARGIFILDMNVSSDQLLPIIGTIGITIQPTLLTMTIGG